MRAIPQLNSVMTQTSPLIKQSSKKAAEESDSFVVEMSGPSFVSSTGEILSLNNSSNKQATER